MALKLFRATEYSSSSLFSHTRPQGGVWPSNLLVFMGLWLAFPANLALWRAVWAGTDGSGLLMVLALAAGIVGFNCAVLSVLAWRGLLKAGITALMLLSAIGTYTLLSQSAGPDAAGLQPWPVWQRLVALLALFLVPLLVVWQLPVRLITLRRQFGSNFVVLSLAIALLAVGLWGAGQNLQALVRYQPGWACMINPAAPVLKITGQCLPSTAPAPPAPAS